MKNASARKYYVTTPIYYVNDKPTIGSAYTTIAADVMARFHRLKGDEVIFLTGTDENSQKNVDAAKKAGIKDMATYLDGQAATWQAAWDSLNISNTDFIRTTEERHKRAVEKFFSLVSAKGDIYKGLYKGYYCTGCEEFKLEGDLVEGKCPLHLKEPQVIEEENYFFAASKYRDAILAHIEANPDFIQPTSRLHEIVNYIKDHFSDISISRQSVSWGIPLPIDPSQVVYVWFDALINYLTAVGFGTDDEYFSQHWPADLHLVGKDIIKFHCALWPAMLLSAGIDLPKRVFANGFLTVDGQKISKSLGNAIDPVELTASYGLDAVRYFVLREVPFGQDGDFSYSRLSERYAADLAKGLGNFVSRVITLAEKVDPTLFHKKDEHEGEDEIRALTHATWVTWEECMEQCRFDEALELTWKLLRWGDRHVEHTKPWALHKEDPEAFVADMSLLVELTRQVSLMIYPIMPETAEKIWQQLGLEHVERMASWQQMKVWRGARPSTIHKEGVLFAPLSID